MKEALNGMQAVLSVALTAMAISRRVRLLVVSLLVAPGLWACVTQTGVHRPEAPDAFGAQIDALAKTYMDTRKIPGMAIAVIQDGQVVKRASYGLASVELGAPVNETTLFTMASTSKEFTSVAIMSLVADGRIRLDQSVREILPELPEQWSTVTVANCLSHTSGLPDNTDPDTVNIIPIAGERDKVLELLAQRPVTAPGVASSYNQTGFMILGMIIERVANQSFESFIEQRLLKPLAIGGMAFGDSWAIIPNRATSYTALKPDARRERLAIVNGQPIFEAGKIYAFGAKGFPEWMNPSAGINASLDAMIAWETALRGGRVLKPETLAEMGKPFRLADGKAGGFGLGLIPGTYKGMATVSSGGGAAVWTTTIPERELTVIVLTNLQGSFPQSLISQIFDAYFSGREPMKPQ